MSHANKEKNPEFQNVTETQVRQWTEKYMKEHGAIALQQYLEGSPCAISPTGILNSSLALAINGALHPSNPLKFMGPGGIGASVISGAITGAIIGVIIENVKYYNCTRRHK